MTRSRRACVSLPAPSRSSRPTTRRSALDRSSPLRTLRPGQGRHRGGLCEADEQTRAGIPRQARDRVRSAPEYVSSGLLKLTRPLCSNLRQALDRIRTETARIGESHEKLAACANSRMASLYHADAAAGVSSLASSVTSRALTRLARRDGRRYVLSAARDRHSDTPQPQSVLDKAYKEKSRQEALVTKVGPLAQWPQARLTASVHRPRTSTRMTASLSTA